MSDRERLAELLMQVYDHGAQPNALSEADAILAGDWLAERDRQVAEKAWDAGYRDSPAERDSGIDRNPHRVSKPNAVRPGSES